MYLVASAVVDDLAALRAGPLWRDVRRFNAPIQLAIAAGLAVGRTSSEVALISLAPCQTGSPALHRWVHDIASGAPGVRMNPTHTLHAVDNLALSVLSIRLEARGYGMGLGGAPGMLWSALELVLERGDPEVIVVAGDQQTGHEDSAASAIALRFAREAAPPQPLGRTVRLVAVERTRAPSERITPHAAAGGCAWLAAVAGYGPGHARYRVPAQDGDGLDAIELLVEVA
ncbi:MAG: hypothetical protein WKG01_17135 [Kofleriaceae bacterium]